MSLQFIDTDECASDPCQNEGTCNDMINHFTCDCPTGYQGITCGESELNMIFLYCNGAIFKFMSLYRYHSTRVPETFDYSYLI